jgi:tryptophan synthase beta chain
LGVYPDVVISCAGGGSNFAGAAFPFVADKIAGKKVSVLAAEPTSCPTMTKGPYAYDFGDTNQTTPLLPMHTLGHDFVPAPIHAGGLRYHGMAPMVSHAVRLGLVEPRAYDQIQTFEAGLLFARSEGFIPAPETNHAIACVLEEAKKAKEEGKQKVIFFNFSGHGLVDLAAYEAYLAGKLQPYELPQAEIDRALKALNGLPKIA